MKKSIIILLFTISIFSLFTAIQFTSSYSSVESKRNLNLYYFYNKHYDINYLAYSATKNTELQATRCTFTITDLMVSKMIDDSLQQGKMNFTVSYPPRHRTYNSNKLAINFEAMLPIQTVRIRVQSEKSYLMDDLSPDGKLIRSTVCYFELFKIEFELATGVEPATC